MKRGDIPQVLQSRTREGVLAVVDGYFHLENLSVAHLELRYALKRGWSVWGLSSMGAIRAAEMHHMDVRGWGRVFETYRDDPDFRDDEVALLHEPNPPYRESTEPLVHIRAGLAGLVAQGTIDAADERAILDHLMSLWFGERTLVLVRDLILERRPDQEEAVRAWIADFNRYRLKAHDLISFLEKRPWTSPP